MANDVSKLKLFSYNWYDNPTTTRRGSSDSSFRTRSTEYSQSYGVNTGASSAFQNGYIGLDSNNRLTVSSQPRPYEGNLSLANNNTGRLTTADSIGARPEIPEQYVEQASRFSVSEAQYADLMNQPDFVIPRVGSGLRVTTDGNGGIAGVAIDPTAVGVLNTYSVAPLQNRSEITAGAVFKVDPTDSPYATSTLLNPGKNIQPTNRVNGVDSLQNQLASRPNGFQTGTVKALGQNFALNPNSQLGGIQSPDAAFGGLSLRNNGTLDGNVLLSRLAQLNPPENGLSVAGFNSQLDPLQSRQLATAQAGFDVTGSLDMRQVAAQIASAARYQDNYANIYNKMDRLMDGRMPFGATPQATASIANPVSSSYRITPPDAIDATDSMMDAASRRSGNGYLPFQFGSGESFSSSSGFAGDRNPSQNAFQGSFSGSAGSNSPQNGDASQNGQFRQRRTPFALIA